jgi:2-methylisocitrate lyase-like PEP mutase family enzyme
MVRTLGQLPLAADPGQRWIYGVSTDVVGYLCEVLSGLPFDRFLQERIFGPLGMPDTGLISYGEMVEQGRSICAAVAIPVIGDGDTGYGNPMNVRRTVAGYAAAGFASVMIEDQLAPKRCGHTRGKSVVSREEALARVRAAVDAREQGADVLILARTDARAPIGLEEAIWRARAFADLGADIVFVEAPRSEWYRDRPVLPSKTASG